MHLEGVTTCVNYADFLDHTLSLNLGHFDEFVVVTTPTDHATHRVCQKHGVTCVETEVFYERGDRFNKGMAINLGVAHLRHTDWLVHMDSDIVLPDRFRSMLGKARLEEHCIYGADRKLIQSFEKWEKFRQQPQRQFQHRFILEAEESAPLGARVIHNEFGYCPIGYFQLWHSRAKKRYPVNQGSAEHTDLLFACQWKPENRRLLPTVIVYHLESEKAPMGANWQGRVTPPFRPHGKHHRSSHS